LYCCNNFRLTDFEELNLNAEAAGVSVAEK